MLYIIGGVPRVGKSTLAEVILARNKISYIDADWLIHMLMYAAPQLGVKVFTKFNQREFINKAENFYPFLYQFIKYNQPVVERFVLEGDCVLPKQVSLLQNDFQIKACFLGSFNLQPETLLNNPSKNNWWIKKLNPQELKNLCAWIVDMSKYLNKECRRYNIAYFDVAENFDRQIESAYQYLLGN